jgi:Protein of unknown function DUF262
MKTYNAIKDIPQFPRSNWHCNVSWSYLKSMFDGYNKNLDPPYQRGYVWTQFQKEKYIEFILMGGQSGKDIYWNCPNWDNGADGDEWGNTLELVDGKQRLRAVTEFLENKVKAFGKYLKQYSDEKFLSRLKFDFIFHVNTLKTKTEVVEWYLAMNAGGSIHTEKDLDTAKTYLKSLRPIGTKPETEELECPDCDSNNFTYIEQYANGSEYKCNNCGRKFIV